MFQFGSKYVAQNLTWTQDLILKSCETDLKRTFK